ncbi:MAG TPA: sigma-70 family RNA polymerase sigma factor [Balneolales bacterium]|nr:sigma-70 family RNA polymerase sigma factor [Balneolales bacterium]
MTEESLRRLIEGCVRQERASQKALYEAFYGFAMAICLRFAGNRFEAVEIMNEGFFKVLTNIAKYDSRRPFKPWIGRIMTNTAIDYYRSKYKTNQFEELDQSGNISDGAAIMGKLAYQDLLAFIQRLPPGYRTVFNLYVIDGFTHKEIAEMLNISIGTSKSDLHKARQKLQGMILKEARIVNEKEKNV